MRGFSSYAYRCAASTPNIPGRKGPGMFGYCQSAQPVVPLEAEERQRVDGGGCSSRRVKTSVEGIARVQRHGGVDAAEQRVQVEVAERRHQRVGDGVGGASNARDGG